MTASALTNPIPPDPGDSQRAASNPTASVWVNASAGSGKTTVLTNRVTRLLLDGVRPEKILCLTYTRAGAAEMANRVTGMLSKWATCDDRMLDEDLDRLQNKPPSSPQKKRARQLFAKVLSCPGGLRIRTIHSFCQEILSRFPLEAGLPPYFALIDEQETEILRNEILDAMLHEAGEKPQSEIAQALDILVAAQGEHGFTKMLQEVMHARGKMAEAAERAAGAAELGARIRMFLQLEPEDTPDHFRIHAMQNLDEKSLRQLVKYLSEGTPTHSDRAALLASILDTPAADRANRFDDYCSLFLTREGMPRKVFGSKDILHKYPDIEPLSVREATLLQLLLERIESAGIAQITTAVLSFGTLFAHKLATRKAARAALDYDDLIHFTENLLRRPGIAPWILYKLDNGIDHILVDEAQDTSRAQWNIVQALTAEFFAGTGAQENKGRTLFVVGDEKQSIFSFQNADPEGFLSLRTFFDQKIADAGKKLEKIGLHTSFRSAPAILRAVDQVFANDEAREGVSPDPVAHTASRKKDGIDKSGHVEVWPLLTSAAPDAAKDGLWAMPTGYEEEQDPQAELAQQIARKISGWLTDKTILPGADRSVAAGDIMILLRRRGRFADLMVRALKTHKVPVTGIDRMHLVSQLPVMDLLAMLRFVLLPEDDLNLATLLRSPLLGISEEQLMQLAIGRSGTLWQSVKTTPAFAAIHDYLTAKLNTADFTTPFAFLSDILNAPCPANTISGRKALWSRLGDEALDPIEELLNEAQNFGRFHAPSLQNFLHWLTQSDKEIKRELDRGGGQVRIMTVHASKGLEAPIVFLPDTASVPRGTDIPKLQWSKDGIPLFLTRQPKFGTAQQIWQNARTKQMQEYRRLLYVALTRASHRLYICGWQGGKNEGDLGNSWYGLASNALRLLHQEHNLDPIMSPAPDIVFADAAPLQPPVSQTKVSAPEKIILPAWAFQNIAPVKLPLPSREGVGGGGKPPSTIPLNDTNAATPDAAFARGRIIHRLLQSLPDIAPASRADAAARFLSHPRHNLTPTQREEIAREAAALLSDENFTVLFAPDSLAEAPLTGLIDGMPAFRQVDRLCLYANEVWIVDYKTNRPPPQKATDIPASYQRQMDEYRQLLREIYPDRKIRCFLLWTYAPTLMEV